MEKHNSLIGTVIQNRYQVLRVIGEGGMGIVYEGKHLSVERRVAIKHLHPEFARDPDIIKRFQREAQAATATGNEHVVEVFDLDVLPDGSPFMVMEFLEGTNLDQLVESNGPLNLGHAARILVQVCDALNAAHRAGIVHRDLKPDNIFLIPRGANPDFVKVLDFGISKFKSSAVDQTANLTAPGTMIGTPRFMAPEQIKEGFDVDQRADIFALGGILYYALTANVPFSADTLYLLWIKICTEPAPSVLRLRSELPAEIEAIIKKALEKQPERRYSSCAEMKSALWPFLDHSPELISVAPASPSTISKQKRLVPAMLWGGALSAAAIALSLYLNARPLSEARPIQRETRIGIENSVVGPGLIPLQPNVGNRETPATVLVRIEALPRRAKLYLDGRPIDNPFSDRLPLSKDIRKVKAVLDRTTQNREFIPDGEATILLDFSERHRPAPERRRSEKKHESNRPADATAPIERLTTVETLLERGADKVLTETDQNRDAPKVSSPTPDAHLSTTAKPNPLPRSGESAANDIRATSPRRKPILIREK